MNNDFKFRQEVISLGTYLNDIESEVIIKDVDINRSGHAWKDTVAQSAINTSILNGIFIPSLIVVEVVIDGIKRRYLVDGQQRTTYFIDFAHNLLRLSSKTPNSTVMYQEKKRDENGKIARDENGSAIWLTKEFDVAGKKFSEIPKGIQDKFFKHQLSLVIYELDGNLSFGEIKKQIGEILRLYNNHTSMNINQKSFTYLDRFAGNIREIEKEGLFFEVFEEKERIKGTIQKSIVDTLMLMFHFDEWKQSVKPQYIFVNENASYEEFNILSEYNDRLGAIVSDKNEFIFNKKNTFIWVNVFKEFCKYGLPDDRFSDFIVAFGEELKHKEVDGIAFSDIDKSYSPEKEIGSAIAKSSKDRRIIEKKMRIITSLMDEFFSNPDVELIKNSSFMKKCKMSESDKNKAANDILAIIKDSGESIEDVLLTVNDWCENSNTDLLTTKYIPSIFEIVVENNKYIRESIKVKGEFREWFELLTLDDINEEFGIYESLNESCKQYVDM